MLIECLFISNIQVSLKLYTISFNTLIIFFLLQYIIVHILSYSTHSTQTFSYIVHIVHSGHTVIYLRGYSTVLRENIKTKSSNVLIISIIHLLPILREMVNFFLIYDLKSGFNKHMKKICYFIRKMKVCFLKIQTIIKRYTEKIY